MNKLLQISIEVNSGSVGRIAEQIGQVVISAGWDSYITYARNNLPSKSKTIKIGTKYDIYYHGLQTRIFDNHCLSSKNATKRLIDQINIIKPDIIQLHHIHGYFLNMKILMNYLSSLDIPIVWVFHDCWSFTGHCAHFDFNGCDRWKKQCYNCPQKKQYPGSLVFDRSRKNYTEKKELFNSIKNLTIIPVSNWLGRLVKQSFLKDNNIEVIQNGIDINAFRPYINYEDIKVKYNIQEKKILLGVASIWDKRKGLDDFIKISEFLNYDEQIILVGLSEKQMNLLPNNIVGIKRTENVQELAKLYSMASVFLNPTYEDTYPTTNLEAMACGTPVVSYNTGGSPESITEDTGVVVSKGFTIELLQSSRKIITDNTIDYKSNCRRRAEQNFNKEDRFKDYVKLYDKLLKI